MPIQFPVHRPDSLPLGDSYPARQPSPAAFTLCGPRECHRLCQPGPGSAPRTCCSIHRSAFVPWAAPPPQGTLLCSNLVPTRSSPAFVHLRQDTSYVLRFHWVIPMNTQIITRILSKMNESRRRTGWNKIGTEESDMRWRCRTGEES